MKQEPLFHRSCYRVGVLTAGLLVSPANRRGIITRSASPLIYPVGRVRVRPVNCLQKREFDICSMYRVKCRLFALSHLLRGEGGIHRHW